MENGRTKSKEALATRTHRFELSLWYDERAAADPSRWRFTLSDPHSNEQVGGVGVAGLPEAVALLTTRTGASVAEHGREAGD